MECRVVRALPSALPVGINPIEKSARKGLLRIAFSSAGTALFRFVRADYVAEDGATQMVNGRGLCAGLRRKPTPNCTAASGTADGGRPRDA